MTGGVDLSLVEAGAELLKSVGFPIFVACWLLFRTDKRLDKIVELITEKKR